MHEWTALEGARNEVSFVVIDRQSAVCRCIRQIQKGKGRLKVPVIIKPSICDDRKDQSSFSLHFRSRFGRDEYTQQRPDKRAQEIPTLSH